MHFWVVQNFTCILLNNVDDMVMMMAVKCNNGKHSVKCALRIHFRAIEVGLFNI